MEPVKDICTDCGKVFLRRYGFLCPECRKKRRSRCAKERNLNKIGNDAYSAQQMELSVLRKVNK